MCSRRNASNDSTMPLRPLACAPRSSRPPAPCPCSRCRSSARTAASRPGLPGGGRRCPRAARRPAGAASRPPGRPARGSARHRAGGPPPRGRPRRGGRGRGPRGGRRRWPRGSGRGRPRRAPGGRSSPSCRSSRASRDASDESTSGSVLPKATCWSSFSKATLGFRSSGRESVICWVQRPTQSTMTKCVLLRASGVDGLEVVRVDDADAPPLHLLEEVPALDRPHEHDDLQRLDVGAGGDHVHGDDDARVVAVAERLRAGPRASRRSTCRCTFSTSCPSGPTSLVTMRAVPVL